MIGSELNACRRWLLDTVNAGENVTAGEIRIESPTDIASECTSRGIASFGLRACVP